MFNAAFACTCAASLMLLLLVPMLTFFNVEFVMCNVAFACANAII